MYRISEIAKLVGISRSTLLYYEKQGLVKGKRQHNSYRLYDESDLQRLRLLKKLQASGLSLQECKACLDAKIDRQLLKRRLRKLEQEIAEKQAAHKLLKGMLGESSDAIRPWHQELERTAPEAHFHWLLEQGFSEKNALQLKWLSRDMNEHDQYMQDFWKIFGGLDQHGPGSKADSLKALETIKVQPQSILDVGSGTGASSLVLAENCSAKITALDIEAKSLATLHARAEKLQLKNIQTCCASMLDIPFSDQSFDVLWSEGSAYIMGFEKALNQWKRFIKPGGFLVLSELVWNDITHPKHLTEFWAHEYPDMQNLKDRLDQSTAAGYQIVDHFNLPQTSWDSYTDPIKARVLSYEDELKDSAALADIKRELDIFDRYRDHFEYTMLILQVS